jgi:hypothetical protein
MQSGLMSSTLHPGRGWGSVWEYLLVLWLVLHALPAPAGAPRGPWREPRVLVFGERHQWVLVHVPSLRAEPVSFPQGYEPVSLTASRDGRTLVFTSRDASHPQDALFAWHWRTESSPRSIGMEVGRHGEPALSPDGKWAYFVHHPESNGPPGAHTSQATAQLAKVRLDGSGYERLTQAPGCHFSPAPAASGRIFFLHTPCDFTRSIRVFEPGTRAVTTVRTAGLRMEQLSLAPDGRHGVYAESRRGSMALVEFSVRTGEVRTLHEFEHVSPYVRPQYGRSAQELLYQHGGAVWSFDGKTATRLFLINPRGDPP